MCVESVCINQLDEFPIIIIHNRDELKTKKSIDAKHENNLIQGIDENHHGTWFVVNSKNKNFSSITDVQYIKYYRDMKSRGKLLQDIVNDEKIIENLKNEKSLLKIF